MKLYKIDQYFEFTFQTQAFATGTATDADATPTYRTYEENNDTVLDSGNCAKRDDSNTTGYYYVRGQCTTALGYEVGKTYEVRVAATVSSVSGAAVVGRFCVVAANVWDSLYGGTTYLKGDVTQWLTGTIPAVGVTGVPKVDIAAAIGTSISETSAGYIAAAFKKLFDVATPALTSASVNQTGDSYAKIGTPVALDGGAATIGGMLTKMADDNSGGTFDATYDSLNKIKGAVTAGVAVTIQASSNVETTGTLIGGTYASTYLSNGTYWVTAPVTPAVGGFGLNAYLGFTLATDQYINSVTIRGYFATGAGRSCNVYAYNWSTLGWDQLSDSTTRMNNASTNQLYNYTLLSSHRKSDGTVRIGFMSTSTTTGDRLNIDQCLVNVASAGASTADIAEAVKQKMIVTFYEAGVWIDTVAGAAGTVVGTNGTPTNPSLTYADALIIASTLGVKRLYLKPGSSITLTQNHDKWRFIGQGSIALGGQSIVDAWFQEIYEISGVGTGDDALYENCGIGTCTLGHAYFRNCIMKGTVTTVASKAYYLMSCSDAVSSGTTTFIFGANTELYARDFRGGIQLNALAATNSAFVDGAGRVILNTDCVAGTVTVRGHFTITDNVLGGFAGTITDSARWAEDQSIASVTTSVPNSAGVTTILGQLTGITSVAAWLRGLFRKDAMNATAKSEVNTGGGGFDEATDSVEAIRDTPPLGTAMRGTDSAALAATALSNAVWTDAKAGYLTGNVALDSTVAKALLDAESYAADGGTPTLSQMMWMLWSAIGDFSISGTTLTCKKQDGTSAMTFTLNDGTSPTSRTRAT